MLIRQRRNFMMTAASVGIRPQDVFEVVTATGANLQAGIDALLWEPNLVISKNRDASSNWVVRDSVRGMAVQSPLNATDAESAFVAYSGSAEHVAYCFKVGQSSLDVKTFTHGAGTASIIEANLLFPAGLVIVKRRDASGPWYTWASTDSTNLFNMDSTSGMYSSSLVSVSGTTVTVSSSMSSGDYVMYAFPQNPDIYHYGTLSVNDINQGRVTLQWPPNVLFMKNKAVTASSTIRDFAREWPVNHGNTAYVIYPNASAVESTENWVISEFNGPTENLLVSGNSISNAAWQKLDGAVNTTSTTASFPSSNSTTFPRIEQSYALPDSMQVWVYESTLSGSGQIEMHVSEETSAGVYANTVEVVQLTSTPTVQSIGRRLTSSDPVSIIARMQAYNNQAATVTVTNQKLYRATKATSEVVWDGLIQKYTFDTTYKVNSNLTNGNMTSTTAGNGWASVVGQTVAQKGSGKWAFEVHVQSASNPGNIALGWFSASQVSGLGTSWKLGYSLHGAGFFGGTGWYFNSTQNQNGNVLAMNSGERWHVLIDIDNKLLWVTKDGANYYGSAKQAVTRSTVEAGSGGFNPSSMTSGPYLPAVWSETSGNQFTVNFQNPAMSTYPAGFQQLGGANIGVAPNTFINSSFLTWAIRGPK